MSAIHPFDFWMAYNLPFDVLLVWKILLFIFIICCCHRCVVQSCRRRCGSSHHLLIEEALLLLALLQFAPQLLLCAGDGPLHSGLALWAELLCAYQVGTGLIKALLFHQPLHTTHTHTHTDRIRSKKEEDKKKQALRMNRTRERLFVRHTKISIADKYIVCVANI